MSTLVTDFQSPEPETEFEEVRPLRLVRKGDIFVIEDPNDPPLEPRAVNCCQCTAGITVCVPEQERGEYMTSAGAHGFIFWGG